MRVFISQTMTGSTAEEILYTRKEAIKYIEDNFSVKDGEKIEIIDSVFIVAPVDAKPLWYLGRSLELLSTVDVCLFVGDWKKERGRQIEHECCEVHGIEIRYLA